MKKTIGFIAAFLLVFQLNAQESFKVPELTDQQKQEVLYNHAIAYAATGISFAKTKGTSPEDYGKYIGSQFTAFWNPDEGFPAIANGLMFIMRGMHPGNEMVILDQSDKMVKYKLTRVDQAFEGGPMFGVSYEDFLECSYGIISVLADHMNTGFEHEMTNDGWYVVKMWKK